MASEAIFEPSVPEAAFQDAAKLVCSLIPYYFHPRMLAYDFGPQHPFRPERLTNCQELLDVYGVVPKDPGLATRAGAERVHSEEYLDGMQKLDLQLRAGEQLDEEFATRHGFCSGDNPPFEAMWEASLAFISGTVRAAEDVVGGAPMALTLAGGLHHASRDQASGFCLISDPSIAISILLERFDRVAYVDIDLHHGDGVQSIWYDDPRVLTCSIHQDGRTLFPGTGFVEETGAAFTSLNVPLAPGTTGDVWIDVFRRAVLPALDVFQPQAIVLQMGCDPHFTDPLGHLQVAVQDWLEAVREVKEMEIPLVACGGGGYSMQSVVRMWSAAILELLGIECEDRLPDQVAKRFGVTTFSDSAPPGPIGTGREQASQVVGWLTENLLPRIPRP